MSQSRKMSAVESAANVAIGYSIAVASQMVLFPLFGLEVTFQNHLVLGGFFTAVSLVRSYTVRRLFNHFGEKI